MDLFLAANISGPNSFVQEAIRFSKQKFGVNFSLPTFCLQFGQSNGRLWHDCFHFIRQNLQKTWPQGNDMGEMKTSLHMVQLSSSLNLFLNHSTGTGEESSCEFCLSHLQHLQTCNVKVNLCTTRAPTSSPVGASKSSEKMGWFGKLVLVLIILPCVILGCLSFR